MGSDFDSDLQRCQDERNWLLQVAEDYIPRRAFSLSPAQREFLISLVDRLDEIHWDHHSVEVLDYQKALLLQDAFRGVLKQHNLSLRDALKTVFDSFLEGDFTVQIGLFLLRLDRSFALDRMKRVAQS